MINPNTRPNLENVVRIIIVYQAASFRIFPFLHPNPTCCAGLQFRKDEQGSGRMTYFCPVGIKIRRSKAYFTPTWYG